MLTGLLTSILGVPFTLAKQVLEKLRDEIDVERLITEESIKMKLQQFQLQLQDGEMTEAEYTGVEEFLITRLRAVREYQKSREVT